MVIEMPTFSIFWREGPAAGYTDKLPRKWFTSETENDQPLRGVRHTVSGPRGGRHEAQCDVTVRETEAELDYGACRSFNERRGVFLGVLKIQFTGPDRERVDVDGVEWQEPGGRFDLCNVTVS